MAGWKCDCHHPRSCGQTLDVAVAFLSHLIGGNLSSQKSGFLHELAMLADKQVELLSQQSDFHMGCTTPRRLSQFFPNLLLLGSDFSDGIHFGCWQVDTSTALTAILTGMAPNLDTR